MAGRAAIAFATALVLLAAGCGDNGESAAWEGPERPFAADGTIPVEDFTAYADAVDERWERSTVLLAGEFLRLDRSQATGTTLESSAPGEGTETATVTASLSGLQDDSIAAERYVLGLHRSGEIWQLHSAMWTQSCRPGRGHEDFTPEPCV